MYHYQGALQYRSKVSGLKNHRTACGLSDSFSVPTVRETKMVTCSACLRTRLVRDAIERAAGR